MAIELGAAYVSILPETSKIAPGIRKAYGEAEKGVSRSGGKSGKGWAAGMLGAAGKLLGGAAVVGIGAVAGTAITKGFNRALQLQEAEAKLSGLGNSSKTVSKIMDDALKAVSGTAFGMGEAATVAASAVAAGIKPGKDLQRNLTLVGDAATIAGVGMDEMGAIFNKVAASNKVQMDVINQLHDAGVPALQLVAKELGVTAEEATKMASAGKVDFETFQAAMEQGLGGAAQKSGETFRGSLANMGAALGRLGVGFANPLVTGAPALFTSITGAIDALGAVIAPVAESFGNVLTPALERGAGAVERVAPAIEGLQALLGRGDYTSGLGKALGVDESSGVVGGLLELRGGIVAMGAAFAAGGTAVTSSGFAGVLESIGLVARQLWDAVGPAVAQLVPAIWQILSAFSPLGLVFNALAPVLPHVAKALGDVALALSGALAGAAPALASVATALALIVVNVVQLVAPLLESELLIKAVVLAFLGWKAVAAIIAGVRGAMLLFQAVQLGVTAATYGASGAMVVAGASAKVYGVIMKAQRVALMVAAGAQWALNAAMTANPIGLIIAGVAALVAGLVWFFTQTKIGQQIVSAAWGGIKAAAGAVVDWFQGTALPVLTAVWDGIVVGAKAVWLGLKVAFVAISTAFILMWKWIKAVWSVTGAPIFRGIMKVASAVWSWLKDKVFAPIKLGFQLMALGFVLAYRRYILPAWNGIKNAATAAWNWVKTKVINPFQRGLTVLGAVFRVLWRTYVVPAFNGIRSALGSAWAWVKRSVFDPMMRGLRAVGGVFKWLWRNAVVPAWDGIKTAGSAAWGWIQRSVFAPFKRGISLVGDAFKAAGRIIKRAWDGIKKAAAAPVNFVIDTVYNKGIRATWNDVADAVGLDLKLPKMNRIGGYATGGVLPGYTPGRDVHEFFSPTGGRLSLSGGEAIMRPEFTRAVGGPAGVAVLNARARKGQAFKNGGVFGGVSNFFGDAWDKIKDVSSSFLSGPASLIKKVITGPMDSLLGGMGGGTIGKIGAQLPRKIVGGLVDKAKDFASSMFGGDQSLKGGGRFSGGPVMGWQNMWNVVKNAFPGASLTSAFRPGAITAVGTKSFHGQGRAIDVTPSMDIFNWLAKTFPNSSELIYSPAGGRQLYMGRQMQFGEPTRGDHWDHVHWAMKNGGVIPGLFDNGGWLPHNGVGINRTGKPEAVLTPGESKALKAGVVAAQASRAATLYAERGSRSDRFELDITNWDKGRGFIRKIADDAVDDHASYEGTTRRMRR